MEVSTIAFFTHGKPLDVESDVYHGIDPSPGGVLRIGDDVIGTALVLHVDDIAEIIKLGQDIEQAGRELAGRVACDASVSAELIQQGELLSQSLDSIAAGTEVETSGRTQ